MAIPSLMNGLNNRLLAAQLKSTYTSLNQLINEQLIKHKTKSIAETDFADPAKLMTSSNFQISKTCSTTTECWGSEKYKRLLDNAKTVTVATGGSECQSTPKSVMLKNGMLLGYCIIKSGYHGKSANGDYDVGLFYVDVNGNDKPNMSGRDFFLFYVMNSGKLVGYDSLPSAGNLTDEQMVTMCKSGSYTSICTALYIRNNWKVVY